jgi:hypothetical protein
MRHFLAVLCLTVPSIAYGQYGELGLSVGASILGNKGLGSTSLSNPGRDDVFLTNGFRFGFRVTFNQGSHFGHEIFYAYNRTHLKIKVPPPEQDLGGMAIHLGGYSFLIYATPEGSRIRPFAAGGAHFAQFNPPGQGAGQAGGEKKWGLNYGGGVKVRLPGIWQARVDLRQYATPKPFDLPAASGWLRQTEASVGFGVTF